MRLTEEALAEIKAIEDRRGRLTPQEVLEAARPEGSALHDCFEWDDNAAAEAYRVEQARQLIRRVKLEIVIEDRTFKTVNYVRDPDKGTGDAGYRAVMKVTKTSAGQMMRNELEAVSALMERAVGLAYAKAGEIPGLAGKIIGIKAQVDRLAESV